MICRGERFYLLRCFPSFTGIYILRVKKKERILKWLRKLYPGTKSGECWEGLVVAGHLERKTFYLVCRGLGWGEGRVEALRKEKGVLEVEEVALPAPGASVQVAPVAAEATCH